MLPYVFSRLFLQWNPDRTRFGNVNWKYFSLKDLRWIFMWKMDNVSFAVNLTLVTTTIEKPIGVIINLWSWATVQLLLATLSIFLNSLVIHVVSTQSEVRSFLNVLLANLAVACVGLNVFATIVNAVSNIIDFYSVIPVLAWYRYYVHVHTFFNLAINLSICSLGFNCFVAVMYPDYYDRSRSPLVLVKVIAPIWIFAFFGGLLSGLVEQSTWVASTFPLDPCRRTELGVRVIASVLDTAFMMAPTALMVVCFFNIGVKLYLTTPKIHPFAEHSFPRRLQLENDSAIAKRHVKHSRSVFACVLTWVAVTFPPALLCWRSRNRLNNVDPMEGYFQLWITVLRPLGTVLYPVGKCLLFHLSFDDLRE